MKILLAFLLAMLLAVPAADAAQRTTISTYYVDGEHTRMNDTIRSNGSVAFQIGNWSPDAYYLFNITNETATANRTLILPDADGTFALRDVLNNIQWGAVSKSGSDFADIGGTLPWSRVDKSGSSLADLVTRSAADLSSGTLDDGRLSGNIPRKDAAATITGAYTFSTDPTFNANGVAWASVSKSGSSLADLATRQISDTTGTLGETRGGTGQASYTTGDLLYASASNVLSRLSAGTNGYVLTMSGGVPVWSSTGASDCTTTCVFSGTVTDNRHVTTYDTSADHAYANALDVNGSTQGKRASWTYDASAAHGYYPLLDVNQTAAIDTTTGYQEVLAGKQVAASVFSPTAVHNTSVMIGTSAAQNGEALAVSGTAAIPGSASTASSAIRTVGATVTFTGATGQSGDSYATYLRSPVFTAQTTAGTSAAAATLAVEDAPTCDSSGGAAQTCTNRYAVNVINGNARVGASLLVGASSTSLGCKLCTSAPSSTAGSGTEKAAAFNIYSQTTTYTTTPQTANVEMMLVQPATLINPSSGTIPNAYTAKISGPMVCSTNVVCTNSGALWVASGESRLDGALKANGGATFASAQTFVISPTASASCPSVSEGAFCTDSTNHVLKIGLGSSPSYKTVATTDNVPAAPGISSVADPGTGTVVTCAGTWGDTMQGSVGIATGVSENSVKFYIETSAGSGSYNLVQDSGSNGAATNIGTIKIPFNFFCPTGFHWKYVKTGTTSIDNLYRVRI